MNRVESAARGTNVDRYNAGQGSWWFICRELLFQAEVLDRRWKSTKKSRRRGAIKAPGSPIFFSLLWPRIDYPV